MADRLGNSFRARIAAFVVAACAAGTGGTTAGVDSAKAARAPRWTHVRPLERRAHDAVELGYARSSTFRGLIDEIEQSDLVVYVDVDPYRAHSSPAFMEFMSRTAGIRYVLAWVDPHHDDTDLVALLGHELEHAVELARACQVSTRAGFDSFYRSLGHVSGRDQYETTAAHDAGERIRLEIGR